MLEHALHAGALVEHQMLADHAARIGKPVRETIAGGIEQQSRGLRAIRRQHHGSRRLKVRAFLAVEVVHAGGAPLRIGIHVVDEAIGANLTQPGGLCFRNHGVQRGGLGARLAAVAHAEAAMYALRAAAIRLRRDCHRRRKRMQSELAGSALEQHAGGFDRQRRHGIGLAARRIEGARVGEARHAHFPLHLGVVRLEFLIADRPIGECRSRDAADHAALVEVDFVKAPEIGGVMSAAAAHQSRIGRREKSAQRLLRGFGRQLAECLRGVLRAVGDAVEKKVLQFIVFEIGGRQARPLFEHQDGESGLR